MMKYKLDQLFKDNHGVLYLVVRLPIFTTRKDKKITIVDPSYHLFRIPDMVKFTSKYDGSEIINTYPTLKIEEELITKNIIKGVWNDNI